MRVHHALDPLCIWHSSTLVHSSSLELAHLSQLQLHIHRARPSPCPLTTTVLVCFCEFLFKIPYKCRSLTVTSLLLLGSCSPGSPSIHLCQDTNGQQTMMRASRSLTLRQVPIKIMTRGWCIIDPLPCGTGIPYRYRFLS